MTKNEVLVKIDASKLDGSLGPGTYHSPGKTEVKSHNIRTSDTFQTLLSESRKVSNSPRQRQDRPSISYLQSKTIVLQMQPPGQSRGRNRPLTPSMT